MENIQATSKLLNLAPLNNPSEPSRLKSIPVSPLPSPPIFNINQIKRVPKDVIRGTYNPFDGKKRSNDGTNVYVEHDCIVKCKCIRNVTIIEDDKKSNNYFYFYLIEYEDNLNLLRKLVRLEEIFFEDDDLDFLDLKTIKLEPIIIQNKKRKIKTISKSVSPNENMFQNTAPRLTIDVNI